MIRRSSKFVGGTFVLLLCASAAFGAQADAWKADWEKTLQAAKKEGQLVLYGSPDFEVLFAEFHKKYPEIKVTGVFNRGADVAKRLDGRAARGQISRRPLRQRHDHGL